MSEEHHNEELSEGSPVAEEINTNKPMESKRRAIEFMKEHAGGGGHRNMAILAEMFSLHGLDITLPVECDFCPEKFNDLDLFDEHMITHKECRFFPCQLCNYTYVSWGNLVAHRKACHRGEVLSCKSCGQRKCHSDLGPVNFPVGNNPIGCEECGEGFTTVQQLYRHYRIHGTHQIMPAKGKLNKIMKQKQRPASSEKSMQLIKVIKSDCKNLSTSAVEKPVYKCEWCSKTFTAKKGLMQHRYMHPVREDYLCECGQKFMEWKDMSWHVLTDHQNHYLVCTSCGLVSLMAGQEFLLHYRICHMEKEEKDAKLRHLNITCRVCHKTFSRPSALNRHQKLHNPLLRQLICEICGSVFQRRNKILEHVRRHYGDNLPEKYKQWERLLEKRRKYKGGTLKRSFICEYCGREFNKKINLQIHVRRHTGDRPYKCQLCDKAFYTKQQLAIHVRHHTGERPYSCGTCSKTFTGPTALYVHRKLHEKVKRYTCTHCGRTFFWRSAFIGHVRLHTGERPYRCSICNKAFTLKGKLNLHKKKHMSEQSVPPCSDCGETFSSEAELNAHRDEQCRMTMVTFLEGEQDTRIILMNSEDLEQNNIYIDDSEVVHLVVE